MTQRDERTSVSTTWDERDKPVAYISPLEDAYRIVHDEDDEVIYIYTETGKAVIGTLRTSRPLISNNE